MPNSRHSSAMPVSCLIHLSTNARRCSMGDVSFQGTDPPQVRTVGVTHVLGPFCYPCPRFVPVQGEEPWGVARRPRLYEKTRSSLKFLLFLLRPSEHNLAGRTLTAPISGLECDF